MPYNGLLAQTDAAGNYFQALEKELRELSSQMLSGVKEKGIATKALPSSFIWQQREQ